MGSYEPKWLPGLSLGAARAYYFNSPPGGPSLGDYLLVVQRLFKKALAGSASPAGNDATDQLVSVFARWAVPRSGLETYFEWARNDHSWDLRDLILAPEHSQAYTIGFQRAVGLERGSVLTLGVELTHLERSNDMTYRPTPTWYMHAAIRDGYTQLGQIIGAGIGPGGDAQELRGDLFTGWGGVGAYVRRQVHNNDAHFDLFKTRGGDFSRYDVSAGAGLRGTLLLQPLLRRFQGIGPLEVRWLAEVMLERNRYYIYLNDVRNTHLEVSLRWWPSLGGGGAH